MNKIKPAEDFDRIVHILFADDDPNFLDTARRLLERLGYIVTSATNSDEAMTLIKEHHEVFDIIITDYSMPGINGFELAEQTNKFLMNIPIILYTGRIEPIDEEQIAEAGIAEIVRKPCTIKDLDTVIRKVLGLPEEACL